jgi:hypothetical protein
MSPRLHVSGMSQTENGTDRKQQLLYFSANRTQKLQTSACLLQTKMENGTLFSLVGKRLTVIDDCCFSKHAHLWAV